MAIILFLSTQLVLFVNIIVCIDTVVIVVSTYQPSWWSRFVLNLNMK